jgi:hypothetical protein
VAPAFVGHGAGFLLLLGYGYRPISRKSSNAEKERYEKGREGRKGKLYKRLST